MNKEWLQGVLLFLEPIIGTVLKTVSEELKPVIAADIQKWYAKALTTPGIGDDILVSAIATLLGVPVAPTQAKK